MNSTADLSKRVDISFFVKGKDLEFARTLVRATSMAKGISAGSGTCDGTESNTVCDALIKKTIGQ
jgi:hypothetical protein